MTMPENAQLEKAAAVIRNGGLVAMPTETVYGLAADATSDQAVARIFEAKGRPQFNPLIVHVADADMAGRYVSFDPLAEKLAAAFWPGPLTLVLPRKESCKISLLASAGLDTLGVRAPGHEIARQLIKQTDRPLAAPSANRSGSISPTMAAHVQESLGDKVDMILDGGPCAIGVESTIVKTDGETAFLLRHGGISVDEIERLLGMRLMQPVKDKVEAPGMLTSHYAPQIPLRLNVKAPAADEAYLGFGACDGEGERRINLSAKGDLREAAANLFAYMRTLDRIAATHGLKAIAAAPIPMEGLGLAINDRLQRAAAPRE